MEILREFLETSTIHGLSRINGSKSVVVKVLWILAVIYGFFTSGLLIHQSYQRWGNSPIASTISTHPISSLSFPEVIVCPPKGSNTALNHDLVKVGEGKLGGEAKQRVLKSVEKIFMDDPHWEYARQKIALINEENIRDLYEGYQSLPKDIKFISQRKPKDMVELYSSALRGAFSSPKVTGESSPCWERSEQHTRYVLDFPKNIKDLIGPDGSVVVQVSVDLHDSEGHVTVNRGEKSFLTLNTVVSWEEAEDSCLERGGHLASILTPEEKKQLDGNPDYDVFQFFLGGKKEHGEWRWSDGNIFRDDNSSFYIDTTYNGDCLWYNSPFVESRNCSQEAITLCKIGYSNITGLTNIKFTLNQNDFDTKMPRFILDHHQYESLFGRKSNGFTMAWYIEAGSFSYEFSSNKPSGILQSPKNTEFLSSSQKVGQRLNFHFSIQDLTDATEGELMLVMNQDDITKRENVWSRVAEYNVVRKKYVRFGELETTWRSAYSICLNNGGDLPSVHSRKDLEELGEEVGEYTEGYWLGGRLLPTGTWAWSDGSPWDYTNWDSDDPKWGHQGGENNCSVIWDDLTWWDWPCPQTKLCRFACQHYPWLYKDNIPIQSNVSATNLIFSAMESIHVWVRYNVTKLSKVGQSIPGFQISWYTKDENIQQTDVSTTHDVSWTQSKGIPGVTDSFVVRIVNMIPEAKERNISAEQLLDEAIRFKKKILTNQNLIKWCNGSEIKEAYKMDIVDGFLHETRHTTSLHINRYQEIFSNDRVTLNFRTISDEDLRFGLSLYFVLTFCSVEDFKLFLFHKNLVNSKRIRTILQAAKNNINSRNVRMCDNRWRMKTFFKELTEVLELDLSGILRAISTEAQLQGLNENELPYLKEENMTQFSLQTGIKAFQTCLIDFINAMLNPPH